MAVKEPHYVYVVLKHALSHFCVVGRLELDMNQLARFGFPEQVDSPASYIGQFHIVPAGYRRSQELPECLIDVLEGELEGCVIFVHRISSIVVDFDDTVG
jgi:hypothetical protein